MRKITGILESAPRGERSVIITLRVHTLCVQLITYVHTVRVYFSEDIHLPSPLHTRLLLASAWEAPSSSSDSEESQGGAATSLLDAPKLSELGIMNFFQHNDNNCELNTISFGEMWNRIMQQYWSIINASLALSTLRSGRTGLGSG